MISFPQQVEDWYRKNADSLLQRFAKVVVRSNQRDPLRGAVIIEIEHASLVATMTVWNKGDIEVAVLTKGAASPLYLDDRMLEAGEDIAFLLDGYTRKIAALA